MELCVCVCVLVPVYVRMCMHTCEYTRPTGTRKALCPWNWSHKMMVSWVLLRTSVLNCWLVSPNPCALFYFHLKLRVIILRFKSAVACIYNSFLYYRRVGIHYVYILCLLYPHSCWTILYWLHCQIIVKWSEVSIMYDFVQHVLLHLSAKKIRS